MNVSAAAYMRLRPGLGKSNSLATGLIPSHRLYFDRISTHRVPRHRSSDFPAQGRGDSVYLLPKQRCSARYTRSAGSAPGRRCRRTRPRFHRASGVVNGPEGHSVRDLPVGYSRCESQRRRPHRPSARRGIAPTVANVLTGSLLQATRAAGQRQGQGARDRDGSRVREATRPGSSTSPPPRPPPRGGRPSSGCSAR